MAIHCSDSRFRRWSFLLPVVFLVHQAALRQGSYAAQVRGTVTDSARATEADAKVTVTNESTSIVTKTTTNASGEYVVNGCGLRATPIKVEAPGPEVTNEFAKRMALQGRKLHSSCIRRLKSPS
jgi:hypothetical protein